MHVIYSDERDPLWLATIFQIIRTSFIEVAIRSAAIISFGYVDSYAKIFLILCTPFENSTTRIAIVVDTRFQIIRTHIIEVAIRSAAIISYLPKHKAKDQELQVKTNKLPECLEFCQVNI